jgi:hypothetical protein
MVSTAGLFDTGSRKAFRPILLVLANWQAGITVGLLAGSPTSAMSTLASSRRAAASARLRSRALAAVRGPGKAALPFCRAWLIAQPSARVGFALSNA